MSACAGKNATDNDDVQQGALNTGPHHIMLKNELEK
jgi:hypothetical protein